MTRFIADSMVGKLAKWLRALGYDTLYFRNLDDEEMVALASREGRLLLTRDRPLAAKHGERVLLVDSDDPMTQLREVFHGLGLRLDENRLLTRCMVCNTEVLEVRKEDVQERVPPFVYRNHTRFVSCPGCNRVYWRASHVKDICSALRRSIRDRTGPDRE